MVRWLVVSDTNYGSRENELFYLKRYLLNTANKKEYIIISTDGTTVSQSRWDCNNYEYNGRLVNLNDFNDIYSEKSDFSLLTIDDGELTIKGFNERFIQWLQLKKQAIDKEINRQKEQEQKLVELRKQALEEELKRQKEIVQKLAEQQVHANGTVTHAPFGSSIYISRNYTQARPKPVSKSYEERKAEILGSMDQQEEQVRDSTDTRWIKCELCGKIGEDAEFSSYGGPNHVNLGVCSECMHKMAK